MQGVHITMGGPPPPPGGPPPPPPAGGTGTRSTTIRNIPVHKVLAIGDLGLGIGLVAVHVLSIITSIATLQFITTIVRIFLTAGGLMMALTSLFMWQCTVKYFGFVQWLFGSGSLLTFLGIMSLGTGSIGRIVGWISIVWGCLEVLAHLYFRKTINGTVRHVLLRR